MNKDWLNAFVEKNIWAILSILVMGGVFATKVQALENKYDDLSQQMSGIIENQKAIIELQTKQLGVEDDITEMKSDIKILLGRSK